MQTKRRDLFSTVRTEGAILPADLLQRVAEGDGGLDGLRPEDYHLSGEKVNEAVNRAWNRLLGAWKAFHSAREKLPQEDPATSVAREKWLLPLFRELDYGRLPTAKAVEIEGKSYAVSHAWEHAPIHLLGWGIDVDRRTRGVAGAATTSPHSMVQEFLNRSDDHLWAFLSNGQTLRILRDNVSLTRAAYVEFDLKSMMEGEVYADITLLWLLCHQSRVESERPEQCWLEKWSQAAHQQGARALDQLRKGVEEAIKALGRGFLSHPNNASLRDKLYSGDLSPQDYYRELLRMVYRLLFLFVAEDRGLLLDPKADQDARERYTQYYSTARIRHLAERHRGTRHSDIYHGLILVMRKLGSDDGCPELGLPALGSFLWSEDAITDLVGCHIPNTDLLAAIRELAFTVDGNVLRAVDYKNLGAEELGSIYESLLELHPQINQDAGAFELGTAAGHERKTTGSYYTPTSLINCLLDSALDPVVDEAVRGAQQDSTAEQRILDLKICDPACGSGHFLIAAAHRVGKRLAAVRTGDEEPAPEPLRHAVRDVIGHCIFGVDINPMAVELCKINLWLESLEPGKPLSFLDHHIQCGNSLLGATPALLKKGIPDVAFKPIEGDDKKVCAAMKMLNRDERAGQKTFFTQGAKPWERMGDLAASLANLDHSDDGTVADVRSKQKRYENLVKSSGYLFGRLWADAWCAAFVWKKTKPSPLPSAEEGSGVRAEGGFDYGITEEIFRQIERNPHGIAPWMRDEIQRLARQYQFFHWHLAFPQVFRVPADNEETENEQAGWSGGFDVVLGNPPWVRQEMLRPVKQLLVVFASFKSTADSSVYFLELGLNVARNQGRVAMLTPNKWFRASYGEPLRKVLRNFSRLHLLVDFGHSRNLFPDADTFPAAISLEPTRFPVEENTIAAFVQAHDSDRERHSLKELLQRHAVAVPHGNLRSSRWQLESADASRLLDRLLTTGVPLGEYHDRSPLSGLKTGFNQAFYVDSATRDDLVASNRASDDVLKKFLRGRDVKRWTARWDEQWHIAIPSSQNRTWPWSQAVSEQNAEEIFAATYPSVYRHLKQYERALRKRQDKGRYWWELRACDYYDTFEEPKILVQCIAYYCQFAIDADGHYVNNKVIVIPSNDLYVLAVLNSRITWWIVNRTFQHMKDEGLSVDVQFLLRVPIPEVDEDQRREAADAAQQLVDMSRMEHTNPDDLLAAELRLNSLVSDAFELTPNERQVLQDSLPPRDPIATLELQGALAPRDREISPAATIDTAFPGSDRDKWLCAVMLDLVEVDPGRAASAYLDAMWLATHPDRCEPLLTGSDRSSFRSVTKSLPKQLAKDIGATIPWRDLGDTLFGNRSLQDASGGQRTQVEVGENFRPVRSRFDVCPTKFIVGVVKAAERLRELQEGTLAVDDQATSLLEEIRQGRNAITQT